MAAPFQPLPSPALQLTQLDQCRIRDRSTIMARHLFADRGDAFADEQVPVLALPSVCGCDIYTSTTSCQR